MRIFNLAKIDSESEKKQEVAEVFGTNKITNNNINISLEREIS